VLYTTAGYLSDLKISPDNARIAFFEHPQKWDDRGPLRVVDLASAVTTLGDGYWGSEGIAWARDGRSIVYSASDTGADYALRSVDLAGNSRIVRRDSTGLVVHEVGEDGRWLVSKYRIGFEIWARAAGMARERDVSWLDSSISPQLSADGTMLLFDEESSHVGANYATCLRRLPDAPVVVLGEGRPRDLSPDGKWALVHIYDTPQRLVAYPTGAGETKELDPGGLGNYQNAAWLPDGKRFLLCGWKTGDPGRCYVKPIDGGSAEPVTPEGMFVDALVSRDGTRVVVRDDAGGGRIFRLDGGDPIAAKGLRPEDQWIRWSADSTALLVFDANELPIRVERVDLATGERRTVLTIEPANRSSLLTIPYVTLADDLEQYAYSAWRTRTQLFTITGLN
jgi:dipeptidyl aminopeptidase/acylaminoacyl peptidase